MAFILGISAHHQESAAVVLSDGVPVAALTESALTRTPMDASLPMRAAKACLARAGVLGQELDAVVFYEKPLRRFERVMVQSLRSFPRGGRAFAREVTQWLGDKLWLRGQLMEEFGLPQDRIRFVEHLHSHGANGFFLSPFEEAAVLVVDDMGEWGTTAMFRGDGQGLHALEETHLPHSLGLAVSAFAQFLGFAPGVGDANVQDLASFGTPCMRDRVASIVGLGPEAQTVIDTDILNLGGAPGPLYRPAMEDLFGPARQPGAPLHLEGADSRDADLAASLQVVLREHAVALARRACSKAGVERLCLAGTLAMDRSIPGAILQAGAASEVFVPPHPCDAGGAMGAALLIHRERESIPLFNLRQAMELGEAPGHMHAGVPLGEGRDVRDLLPYLLGGAPVAWVRGPLEFSSESHRSRLVLALPSGDEANARLLGSLQRADIYRLARVAIPAEFTARFVSMPAGAEGLAGLGQIQLQATGILRDAAPSAVAPDGSVRVQAVDAAGDPELHGLLHCVGESEGQPILLLDTFCLRDGVVPRFDDAAHEAFARSQLAALLIEDRLYGAGGGEGESR
ncbi:MAG: carbamoyltransferase N-terminal domain-containing protein [Planctomycetota bacterium]|nr:carbamoyltransferase N-terminal domain-containing protein [Planctomycetota bacterium]